MNDKRPCQRCGGVMYSRSVDNEGVQWTCSNNDCEWSDSFDPEKTLDAVWCVDSETGERCLIDRKTSQIIVRGVR